MQADTTLAPTEREQFEGWWARDGQFCRAGGGDYEKTFAYQAWRAARAQAPAPQGPALVPLTDEQVLALRSVHGWSKETIRAIEAAIFRQASNGITGNT